MNQVRFSILWKFFLITGFVSIIVSIIISSIFAGQARKDRLNQSIQYLTLVSRICSTSIPGDSLSNIQQSGSNQSEGFWEINNELKNQLQMFNRTNQNLKIARLSVLMPSYDKAQIVLATQDGVGFLSPAPWLSEYDKVISGKTIQTKLDYLDQDQRFYSAIAPVFNESHEAVALLKADMTKAEVFKEISGFWSRFPLVAMLALLLSLVVSYILARIITRPIDRFVSFVNRVSEGNYHLRYEYRTFDEMEKITYALNVMLEKLEGLIETEADRDRLQDQITGFLRIVSAAADGDFTVSANVSADTLGALADSFNLMIIELSNLIRDMQRASEQISRSTNEILKSSDMMADGAGKQAEEIAATYKAVKDMADIVKYANDRSTQAAKTATDATDVARKGTEIVKSSIEGMHRIRETVQETARRVRVLGENSQEIGEILEVISDIANRTNLLGLNATIEAARASEAGRGFAVVADEVRNLAERSSQAAKDIAVLIESIQAGTNEAVMAMEHGTKEVEKETKRVDEAGSALKEILEMVQDSAKLIKEISEAFQHQTKVSQDIARTMESVADIAQETSKRAKKSKNLSDEMFNLSQILSEAVSKFRLPGRGKRTL